MPAASVDPSLEIVDPHALKCALRYLTRKNYNREAHSAFVEAYLVTGNKKETIRYATLYLRKHDPGSVPLFLAMYSGLSPPPGAIQPPPANNSQFQHCSCCHEEYKEENNTENPCTVPHAFDYVRMTCRHEVVKTPTVCCRPVKLRDCLQMAISSRISRICEQRDQNCNNIQCGND